jgi:molybdopterin synthase sulfur carrier subunit
MAIVHLPRSLAALFPGAPRRLEVDGATVSELVRHLDRRWPGMWDRICEPGPLVRAYINVFVDGERADLATALTSASVVHIIPAVAGGADECGTGGSGPEGPCPRLPRPATFCS